MAEIVVTIFQACIVAFWLVMNFHMFREVAKFGVIPTFLAMLIVTAACALLWVVMNLIYCIPGGANG